MRRFKHGTRRHRMKLGAHGPRRDIPRNFAGARSTSAARMTGNAVAAADALPRYIRDKVAQTTQERAAAKAGL